MLQTCETWSRSGPHDLVDARTGTDQHNPTTGCTSTPPKTLGLNRPTLTPNSTNTANGSVRVMRTNGTGTVQKEAMSLQEGDQLTIT